MTTPSESPRPALGELARLATAVNEANAAVKAERASVMGRIGRSTDLQRLEAEARAAAEALASACSPAVILQLVALATGGAETEALQAEVRRYELAAGGDEAIAREMNRMLDYIADCERTIMTLNGKLARERIAARSLTPERPADAD